jgi:hypothetical protein
MDSLFSREAELFISIVILASVCMFAFVVSMIVKGWILSITMILLHVATGFLLWEAFVSEWQWLGDPNLLAFCGTLLVLTVGFYAFGYFSAKANAEASNREVDPFSHHHP